MVLGVHPTGHNTLNVFFFFFLFWVKVETRVEGENSCRPQRLYVTKRDRPDTVGRVRSTIEVRMGLTEVLVESLETSVTNNVLNSSGKNYDKKS